MCLGPSRFLFATSRIEVVVECPELAEDLRLTVAVVTEVRTLDLKEITELLAGISRVLDCEERVRVDGVFQICLPPRIPKAGCFRKPVECDTRGHNMLRIVHFLIDSASLVSTSARLPAEKQIRPQLIVRGLFPTVRSAANGRFRMPAFPTARSIASRQKYYSSADRRDFLICLFERPF